MPSQLHAGRGTSPTECIVQRRLTHYRVPLFEALRDELAGRHIRLRVLVGQGTPAEAMKNDAGEMPWAEPLATRYLACTRSWETGSAPAPPPAGSTWTGRRRARALSRISAQSVRDLCARGVFHFRIQCRRFSQRAGGGDGAVVGSRAAAGLLVRARQRPPACPTGRAPPPPRMATRAPTGAAPLSTSA